MAEKETSGPLNLLRPLLLLSYSAFYLIPTTIFLVTNFQFSTFLHLDDFKDAWFARFWSWFGPKSRDNAVSLAQRVNKSEILADLCSPLFRPQL